VPPVNGAASDSIAKAFVGYVFTTNSSICQLLDEGTIANSHPLKLFAVSKVLIIVPCVTEGFGAVTHAVTLNGVDPSKFVAVWLTVDRYAVLENNGVEPGSPAWLPHVSDPVNSVAVFEVPQLSAKALPDPSFIAQHSTKP
jgi:hypothetical protein